MLNRPGFWFRKNPSPTPNCDPYLCWIRIASNRGCYAYPTISRTPVPSPDCRLWRIPETLVTAFPRPVLSSFPPSHQCNGRPPAPITREPPPLLDMVNALGRTCAPNPHSRWTPRETLTIAHPFFNWWKRLMRRQCGAKRPAPANVSRFRGLELVFAGLVAPLLLALVVD